MYELIFSFKKELLRFFTGHATHMLTFVVSVNNYIKCLLFFISYCLLWKLELCYWKCLPSGDKHLLPPLIVEQIFFWIYLNFRIKSSKTCLMSSIVVGNKLQGIPHPFKKSRIRPSNFRKSVKASKFGIRYDVMITGNNPFYPWYTPFNS